VTGDGFHPPLPDRILVPFPSSHSLHPLCPSVWRGRKQRRQIISPASHRNVLPCCIGEDRCLSLRGGHAERGQTIAESRERGAALFGDGERAWERGPWMREGTKGGGQTSHGRRGDAYHVGSEGCRTVVRRYDVRARDRRASRSSSDQSCAAQEKKRPAARVSLGGPPVRRRPALLLRRLMRRRFAVCD